MPWRLGIPLALSMAALLGASSAQGLPAAGPGYVASFQFAYDSPPFPDTRYHMTVSITGDVCGDPFDNPWLFEATRTGGPSTPPPTLSPVTFAVANPINVTGDRWVDASGAEIATIDFVLRFDAGATPMLIPSWEATGDIVNVVATPTVVPISAQRIAECPAAPPPLSTPSGTASGKVLVNGRRYTSGRPIPYGSKVNVTDGRLTLNTELGTVIVYGNGVSAVFRLVRLREPSDMIGMRLVEGSFNTCRKSAGPNTAAQPVRRLWVRGSGKFQTMGRYVTATRGNWWLTADFCDRSLVHARQGSVLVTDFVTKRKVVVKAPKSYTARREAR